LNAIQISDIKDEIHIPEVAVYHPHLRDIAQFILQLDKYAAIILLIERDLIEVHHVLDQII